MSYINPSNRGIGKLSPTTGLFHHFPLVTEFSLNKTLQKNDTLRVLSSSVLNNSPVFISNETHELAITLDFGIYIEDAESLETSLNAEQLMTPFFPNNTLDHGVTYNLTTNATSTSLENMKDVGYFTDGDDGTIESYYYKELVPKSLVFSQESGEPISVKSEYVCKFPESSFPPKIGGTSLNQPLRPSDEFIVPMYTTLALKDLELFFKGEPELNIPTLTTWELSITNDVVNEALLSTVGNYTSLRGGTTVSLAVEFIVTAEVYEKVVKPYTRNTKVTEKLFEVTLETGNIQQSTIFYEAHVYFIMSECFISDINAQATTDGGFYSVSVTFKNPTQLSISSATGQNLVTYTSEGTTYNVVHNGKFVTSSSI
jgi:hypothetical protein